jgi:hypothetical protein
VRIAGLKPPRGCHLFRRTLLSSSIICSPAVRCGYAMEIPKSSCVGCPDRGEGWCRGIPSTSTATLRNATAEFLGERVERFLDHFDKVFTLHRSSTEIMRGLTRSSRRRCHPLRHPLCRRLPLRLLPLLALGEEAHRQPPTDQARLSPDFLDVRCSCPNGTLNL